MKKHGLILTILAVIGIFISGCQNGSSILEPQNSDQFAAPGLNRVGIPAGATLQSATFSIYVTDPSDQTVSIHRITAPWEEMTVTWNNFGESYDPSNVNSFIPNTVGWHSIDVTSLVQGWLNGTYTDNGLLLKENLLGISLYYSSEYTDNPALRPKLEVCYNLSGVNCFTVQRGSIGEVTDASIWPTNPDENIGASQYLITGVLGTAEKLTLLKFDYEVPPVLASLGDYVWQDANRNGIQDAGEVGVPEVFVYLYNCGGSIPIETTFTDANGYYLFSDLEPGDYFVEFIIPSDYAFTIVDQGGNDAFDSDADPATGRTICTSLVAGENDLTWDAGIYRRPAGCTLTIGYWKTHAGIGNGNQGDMVSQYLPIYLGTPGGTRSLNVTNALIAYRVLNQNYYGTSSNGITKLYAQLLAVKLNIAHGAGYDDIASIIAAADEFLKTHSYYDWGSLSQGDKVQVNYWHNQLDFYNNGFIGPIHCE